MLVRTAATRASHQLLAHSRRCASTSPAAVPKPKRVWPKILLGTTVAGAGLVYIGHNSETVRGIVTNKIEGGERVLDVVDNVADTSKLVGRHAKLGYAALAPSTSTEPSSQPATSVSKTVSPAKPANVAVSRPTSNDPTLAKLFSTLDQLVSSLDRAALTPESQALIAQTIRALDETDRVVRTWQSGDVSHLRKALAQQEANYAQLVKDHEADSTRKLDHQKDELTAEWQEERRALIARYRQEIKRRMTLLREDLKRRWQRDLRLTVDEERAGRLARLDEVDTSLKQLERICKENAVIIDQCAGNNRLQVIAGALRRALDAEQRTAFVDELDALRQLTSQYPMLDSVVSSIPEATAYRGVDTPLDLADRFSSVREQVRRSAMVPEDGGLLSHAVSATASKLIVHKEGNVAGNDVEAILARTEHLLLKSDLDGAARELNQLRGWPKQLARDWIAAARQRLEVLQALEVIESQAYLSALRLS